MIPYSSVTNRLQRKIIGGSGLVIGGVELVKGAMEVLPYYVLDPCSRIYVDLSIPGLSIENINVIELLRNMGAVDISAALLLLTTSVFYIRNQMRRNYSE